MGEMMRSRSWNRMQTKRCSANSRTEEFIVVDDDEVIILDYSESSKGKAPATSRTGNDSILQKVISIDDDDDEDTENVHKAGTSSIPNPLDNEDCQFVQEKSAAFRFTKCNQSFSTMPTPGNRFGLGSDSESDFPEESDSDCEILEGSRVEVREEWEKAFLRKMKKTGKVGLNEDAGPSELRCDTNFGPRFESEQHDESFPFFPPINPNRGKETTSPFFTTDDRNPNSSLFGSQMKEDQGANCATSSAFSKKGLAGSSPLSPATQAENERFDTPATHFTKAKEPIHQNGFKQVEKQQGQCDTSKSRKVNQKKKAARQSHTKKVQEEKDALKSSSPQTVDKDGGTTTSVLGTQSNGVRFEHVIPITDPIASTSEELQGLHDTAPGMDVMFNKEMMKETDEYKKAQEEEWESRQRQLQIQAEEAQRQRRKRKLENTRVTRQLEVERRQKERVEEVRETQKKDEESMNMKEKIRAEITKTLKQLELKCFNMATLLRGLGIQVGGGVSPLPNEVHAAYKRAVLKFHPDRASRGDIRQQVEAEEKFKLIARMKDKFLS